MGKILSVEIKNRNIKLLEGSRNGSGVTIFRSLVLNLEPGSIDDGKIMDMDSVAEAIEKALADNGIKSKNAIFIINTNSTVTRNMELPLLKSRAETMSMIKNELDQLLPVNLSQYQLIYKKTGTVKSENIEKGKYIAYVLPTDIYNEYLKLAERLKLELTAIDLASNCLDRIAEHKLTINRESLKSDEAAAFVDIGYGNIAFSVLSGGKNVFTRISSNGVSDLIKNYSTAFNLSEEASINEILSMSLSDYAGSAADISKISIMEDNAGMWADEFSRYIRYYNSNNKESQIRKIYIYGTYSGLKGLGPYFENHLNLHTEIINELSDLSVKNGQDAGLFDVKAFLNPVLSVYTDQKDINFLTDKKKKHRSKFNAGVVAMAVAAAAILTVAYYGYSYMVEKSSMEKEIAEMDKFIADEGNITLNNEAMQAKNRALLLQKYKNEVDKLKTAVKSEDAVNTVIFQQVAAALPFGTKINSMSVDGASIQLQCGSATRKEVAQFERNLKAIEFIDDVYIPAVTDGTEGGGTVYSYSVVCDLKDVITDEAE